MKNLYPSQNESVFRNTYTTDVTTLVRLYKTYVLPHLEYCSQIWNPTRKKQIIKLEKVQKLFTRLLFHRAFQCHNSMPSYNERLRQLGLKTLRHRRTIADLVFCFRLLRMETNLSPSKYWVFRPSHERIGGFNLHYPRIQKKNQTQLYNFVLYRGARWLQRLPTEILSSGDSHSFRKKLIKIEPITASRVG
ncbi:hypothetical protein COOONC_00868 [Cooperia oncophora]